MDLWWLLFALSDQNKKRNINTLAEVPISNVLETASREHYCIQREW